MKTVDIIYRYEAGDAPKRRPPPDSNAAVLRLDDGNRDFAALLDHVKGTSGVIEQIIPVDPQDRGLDSSSAGIPKQRPFAAVLGCSDARPPVTNFVCLSTNRSISGDLADALAIARSGSLAHLYRKFKAPLDRA